MFYKTESADYCPITCMKKLFNPREKTICGIMHSCGVDPANYSLTK